ncbi:uncharacterized protein [Dendropsophus ebraccatus]|uniref:uncharacterized protein n=1 Tax=Dendropsophus ebraccatus TaxID=150705 RepID=UPI0038314BA1
MADHRRGLPSQLSQEEILEILQKVKQKEMSIEEAIARSGGGEGAKALSPPPTQYNFNVYKFRYRWQKRILQIDFNTQMIFNIEKGTLKKQFPFQQVRSCAATDGLRFSISFHGHQDYELEAASAEDKQSILRIVAEILQMQRADQTSLVKVFVRKNLFCDVILEGLLECLDPSNKWLKYLVKVTRDEVLLYRSQKPAAETLTVRLSDCSVSAETYNATPVFSISCPGHTYIFRIPINEQNKKLETSVTMRDEWVSALQELCVQTQQRPLPEGKAAAPEDMDREEPLYSRPHKSGGPSRSHQEIPSHPSVLGDPEAAATEKRLCSSAAPPVPPYPTLPPPLPVHPRTLTPNNTHMKTKAFHWNTVPQDKIRSDPER